MTYSKRFSSKFFARLLKPEGQNPIRDRATSFEIIFNLLDEKKDKSNYLIVETGCMRGDHTPVSSPYALGDDGASTYIFCLLYTSPSPRDVEESRMPSSA